MKSKTINCLTSILNIETTFTADEWKSYRSNEISELDLFINHNYINTDFIRYRKYIVFGITLSIGLLLMSVNAHADVAVAVTNDKLDKLGRTFVSLIQQAGYWLCFAKGLVDIIKEVLKGGDKAEGIAKIMFKYVICYSAFFLFPFFFDLIKSCFQ